jgi:CubicO group peptidase (beta-lactamase class C family)
MRARVARQGPCLVLIGWMLGAPAAVGHAQTDGPPPAGLDAAIEAAGGLPRLHSFLVSWRGALLVERYFTGARASRAVNIKSASKSIISALVGVAIDRGVIAGVRQPIGRYFPDLLKGDSRKQQITIEDLLTMRSGLQSTSSEHYGPWVLSRNWVQHALSRPLLTEPGFSMEYSTGNTHLLSAILTKATGGSTWQFAQKALAGPTGSRSCLPSGWTSR